MRLVCWRSFSDSSVKQQNRNNDSNNLYDNIEEGVEEGLKGLKEKIEHSIKLTKEKTINDKSLAYKLQREFT